MKLVANLLLLLVSIAVSVGLLELGVAFIYPSPPMTQDKEFDARRGWIYKEGTYLEKPAGTYVPHEIRINSLGLRGPEPDPTVTSDSRIVVLGDSFTFGRVVAEENLFTTALQESLRSRGNKTIEVVNAGVEGYGSAQSLFTLHALSDAGIYAQTYVLQMFTNDILDNLGLDYSSLDPSPLRPVFQLTESGELDLVRVPEEEDVSRLPVTQLPQRSFRSFHVLRSVAESWVLSQPYLVKIVADLGLQPGGSRTPGLINTWYDDKILAEGLPVTKSLLETLNEEVRKYGGQLFVVLIPSPLSVYPGTFLPILERNLPDDSRVQMFGKQPQRSQTILTALVEEIGIPVLDLYPKLIENSDTSLYVPSEGHLNEDGHMLVGEEISAFLGRNQAMTR